jgi:hypothetical protein
MESFITRQRFLCSSCGEADSGHLAFNADVEIRVVMTPVDLRRLASVQYYSSEDERAEVPLTAHSLTQQSGYT